MARNRLTLLEIVQRVLNAMNHDSVSAYNDTIESQQIAEEARILYYDMMDRDDWPHLMKSITLEAVDSASYPTHMIIPVDVTRIDSIRYDVRESGETNRQYRIIHYLNPEEFLDHIYTRNNDDSNVDIVADYDGIELLIINDQAPTYWTSFDDHYVVFDSYDSAIDTNYLDDTKTVARVKEIPPWTTSDAFIPDMPDQMFSAYIAELTAACFNYWKQGTSPVDERRAARGISRLRKYAEKVNGPERKANYGRPRSAHYVRSESGTRGSIRDSLGL